MPKRVHRALTALAVKSVGVGVHNDGGGLRLIVKLSGAKSWVLRYCINGRERGVGLGGLHDVTLAQARDKADKLRLAVKAGVDILEQRNADAQAAALDDAMLTFEQAAVQAHSERRSTWRNVKHRAQWINTLRTYAFPLLGAIKINEVTPAMVREALLAIWLEKPETARRVKAVWAMGRALQGRNSKPPLSGC